MCYVPNYSRARYKPVEIPTILRCFNVYSLEFALTGHHDRTYYASGRSFHLVKSCFYFLFPAFGRCRCFSVLYVSSMVCLTNTIDVLVTRLFVISARRMKYGPSCNSKIVTNCTRELAIRTLAMPTRLLAWTQYKTLSRGIWANATSLTPKRSRRN